MSIAAPLLRHQWIGATWAGAPCPHRRRLPKPTEVVGVALATLRGRRRLLRRLPMKRRAAGIWADLQCHPHPRTRIPASTGVPTAVGRWTADRFSAPLPRTPIGLRRPLPRCPRKSTAVPWDVATARWIEVPSAGAAGIAIRRG